MFQPNFVLPGIVHITDAMGVSFTLIEGEHSAVLFDTGYGTEDVHAYIRTLTDKPLKVLLSHGHHDHMLGARWFDRTYLCREDKDEFLERTGRLQRSKVAKQATDMGVPLPDDFMEAPVPLPVPFDFRQRTGCFESSQEDLGGLMIRIVHVPGHTPGSIVIHVPSYGLLLTGDDWNPCTWMWFPSSMNADGWRNNMISVISALETESGREIEKVLCSHQPMMRTGSELKSFLKYMTDERMEEAPATDMGAPINTHRIMKDPEGWTLIFDRDKITI